MRAPGALPPSHESGGARPTARGGRPGAAEELFRRSGAFATYFFTKEIGREVLLFIRGFIHLAKGL